MRDMINLPSGHFVVALPLNLSVIALSFAGFEILNTNEPRSIAVLRSEFSACSNPRRNNTGSVSDTLTCTPPPEATGFSSGIVLILLTMLFPDDLDDQCDSTIDGRTAGSGPPNAFNAPAPRAPVEFLGLDLISASAHDHLSKADAIESRLLLVEERGLGRFEGSWLELK